MYTVTHVENGHDYRNETDIGPFDTLYEAQDWIVGLNWDGLVEGDHPAGEGFDYYVEDLDVAIGFIIECDDDLMWNPTEWATAHPNWNR